MNRYGLQKPADTRYIRGIPTVAKSLCIISIVAGAAVVGISAVVHRLVNRLLVHPRNMGVRHDTHEEIPIFDWFSSNVKAFPGPACDVCYGGDLECFH